MLTPKISIFAPEHWRQRDQGALYVQFSRYVAGLIENGDLRNGQQLPPERPLAEITELSRVTIRKAVAELVKLGMIEQRRGSGSYVTGQKTEQSLSSLVSFSENMQQRGHISESQVIAQGIYAPTAEETMVLGLTAGEKVARVERLRSADGIPMALEVSALSSKVLPDPETVLKSLYAILRGRNLAPTRAIQRVTAINAGPRDAKLLQISPNAAILKIDRTGFLNNGRPVEFTKGLYRPDIYDFVSELRS